MPQTYKKIPIRDGYGISVLARTRPNGRASRYKEISSKLGPEARTIALRILKNASEPASTGLNPVQAARMRSYSSIELLENGEPPKVRKVNVRCRSCNWDRNM
jgi:hypothetical protein